MKKLIIALLVLGFAGVSWGAGYHATGLTAADSRCSFADGDSWLDWDALDFSAYADGNWFIRLVDSSGYVAEGYAGSVGTGEILGMEKFLDPGFDNSGAWLQAFGTGTWTIAGSKASTGDAASRWLYDGVGGFTVGWLMKSGITIDSITGTIDSSFITVGSLTDMQSMVTSGSYTGYGVAIDAGGNFSFIGTCSAVIDNATCKQVTEPAATAIHILNGPSGSEAWAKIDSGFDYNDVVEIEIVPNATVQGVTLTGVSITGEAVYGVDWDESNSTPTLVRTGDTSGHPAAQAITDVATLPIQTSMKRCILNDAGVVQYYLCPTDSTLKADCSTAANLDGTDGQVMVQIPKFWYLYSYAGTTHSWSITQQAKTGYEAHPAFYKDGAWVDFRYIGAYEGIGYDNGTTAYVDCGTAAANNWAGGAIDTANDKLGSVSGKAPMMDETRTEFRAIALNRGVGWRQQDFYLTSAVQLLYLVEYASFYSQDVIGMGRTELTGGTWVKDSYIGVSGKSNSDGNATANTGGDTNDAYMSYRGIENFYGNIYQWVDGININDNIPYVSNTETDFADGTATNYTRLTDTSDSGITLDNANGYQTTLEQTKGGFLPSAVGGSSSTYITDPYYQSTGWRVFRLGGDAADGSNAGAFYVGASSASAHDDVSIGGRLAY